MVATGASKHNMIERGGIIRHGGLPVAVNYIAYRYGKVSYLISCAGTRPHPGPRPSVAGAGWLGSERDRRAPDWRQIRVASSGQQSSESPFESTGFGSLLP